MPMHSQMAFSYLKFRHLMLIALLVEHGSLHKAAHLLSITQPAVTGMLNDLEALIGFPLFTRSRQGVVPTEQTRQLLGRCHTLLNEFDALTQALARIASGELPQLRVGVVPQAFYAYIPQTVRRFRQAGGGAVRIEEGSAQHLLELLMNGMLDGIVGRLPAQGVPTAELRFVKLYEEDICIVASVSHPLAHIPNPDWARLAQCDWALQRPDSSVRAALAEAFLRHDIALPQPAVETSTYIQNLSIIANTDLLTVAPRRAAARAARQGQVRILDVALPVSPMQVSLICRDTAQAMPALALFQRCFVDSVDE